MNTSPKVEESKLRMEIPFWNGNELKTVSMRWADWKEMFFATSNPLFLWSLIDVGLHTYVDGAASRNSGITMSDKVGNAVDESDERLIWYLYLAKRRNMADHWSLKWDEPSRNALVYELQQGVCTSVLAHKTFLTLFACCWNREGDSVVGANARENLSRHLRIPSVWHAFCEFLGVDEHEQPHLMVNFLGRLPEQQEVSLKEFLVRLALDMCRMRPASEEKQKYCKRHRIAVALLWHLGESEILLRNAEHYSPDCVMAMKNVILTRRIHMPTEPKGFVTPQSVAHARRIIRMPHGRDSYEGIARLADAVTVYQILLDAHRKVTPRKVQKT